MEAKDEDNVLEGKDLDDLVRAVEARRAEGLSVTAACRAEGVSTSTYYRRRRGLTPALGALALPAPAPEWPFERATPKAPLYWDQAFADELTDSFVRREFGAGELRARAGRALSSLAARPPSTMQQRLRRLFRRLSGSPLGAAGPAAGAIALLLMLGLTTGWMVSMAADPAAWLRDQTVQTLAAGAR